MVLTLADPSSVITQSPPTTHLVSASGSNSVAMIATTVAASIEGGATDVQVMALAALGGRSGISKVVDLGEIGATLEIDASSGGTFRAILSADVTALTVIDGPPPGRSQRLIVYLEQGGTGGNLLALPANTVRWPELAPTLSSAPGAVDCLVFDLIGPTIYGNLVGLDYQG